MDDIIKKVTCVPKNKTNKQKIHLLWTQNSFKYTARNNAKRTKRKLDNIGVFQEITTPSEQYQENTLFNL